MYIAVYSGGLRFWEFYFWALINRLSKRSKGPFVPLGGTQSFRKKPCPACGFPYLAETNSPYQNSIPVDLSAQAAYLRLCASVFWQVAGLVVALSRNQR